MKHNFTIAVLCGGLSDEAEVSRVSGNAIHAALAQSFKTEFYDLGRNALPETLDPHKHVIFPAMHGAFGEDGTLQTLLDEAGFAYAGSGAAGSRLCMDKVAAKARVAEVNVPSAPDIAFTAQDKLSPDALIEKLGESIVIKPRDKGSSVGLYLIDTREALETVLSNLPEGNWMAEPRMNGRELTVGVLGGQAMGIVEIIPDSGVYDFEHKYTKGRTQYQCPAALSPELTKEIQLAAERAFTVCGCRDFARVDFILCADGRPMFLEVNTIPGLTETSLLPKSATHIGLDFQALAQRMTAPAIQRFSKTTLNTNTLS